MKPNATKPERRSASRELCTALAVDWREGVSIGCDRPGRLRVMRCGNGFAHLCDGHADPKVYRDVVPEDYRTLMWVL
jgi:hypothetical protein